MQGTLFGISIWSVAKVFFLFALLIYIGFALVVVRQVQLMTDTLEVGFERPVRILALAHLIVSAGVFLLALVIL